MPKVSEVVYSRVTVKVAGVVVTGLVTANFAVSAYQAGVSKTLTLAATEIGAGEYNIAITMPTTTGWLTGAITSPARVVYGGRFQAQVTTHDLEDAYNLIVRPVAAVSASSIFPVEQALELVAYRYQDLTYQRTTQAGLAIDLSGYNNFRFSVYDKSHALVRYTLSGGAVTGDASGNIAWAVPENASFFSYIDSALAAGQDTMQAYWDVVADKGGDATKTVTLLRGPLTLRRFESAA